MAETIISPGVLARENDQSFVTSPPVQRGAAIIGPTVLGPVERPTLVSSFSAFQAIFGGALESGSNEYTYLTSIAANNYFQNGGNSLLVTRVVSASDSWSPATSTTIQNNVEATTAGLIGQLVSGMAANQGSGSAAPATYTEVALGTVSGGGSGAKATVTTSNSNGHFNIAALASISQSGAGMVADTYTNVPLTSSTGTGTGASATIIVSNATTIASATIVNTGSGYNVGDVLFVNSSSVATGSFADGGNPQFVVTQPDLLTEISSIFVTEDGAGYAAGNQVNITVGSIGNPGVAPVITLTDAMIENNPAFTLETISEGVIMNNTYPADSDTSGLNGIDGTLVSGSSDNIRWEIAAVNTASGVFSLLIRRGNDNNNQKVILEQFNNISLDPFAPNYISRAIGDSSTKLLTEGVDTYLQPTGSFPNISAYVRVKEVNAPTPNYFDNDGTAKNEYTSSLPQLGSGSFDGAGGSNIPTDRAANFYQDHSTQISSIINNAASRGDNLAVVDLVKYNQSIVTVTNQAAGIDNSYAAAYWPWLQTIDPNSGQTVYIPASTFIPGVYAFTDESSDPWFAPAGKIRGELGQALRAERKLTSTNRDTLYEANVNPIATMPNKTVVVFGQKTLQKAASALDRVNVRRLLITIKDFVTQISDNLVFEQNSIATRNSFLTQVNPYLSSVQQRQGLFDFKVVMDETNNTPDVIDRNELIGQIFLKPTRTAEFIILDFNVLPTGAVFPS